MKRSYSNRLLSLALDTVTLDYAAWNGKYVSIPASILNTLQTDAERKYMYFTFGNAPVVTSITVYDLGE